jgi:hypothetical protein
MGTHEYAALKAEVQALKAARHDLGHITEEELIALRGYTGNDYARLNAALRNSDDAELRTLRAYIEGATAALHKLPKHQGPVARGMGGVTPVTPQEMKQFKVGSEWVDKGFMSCSIGKPFKGNVKMFVESKSGVRIDSLSQIPSEVEVLFAPGTRFRVLEVTEVAPNQYEVYLREL